MTLAPMRTKAPTIAFVHVLRGLAALIVVFAHLSGTWLYLTQDSSLLQDTWREWFTRPFHIYQDGGHLGVLVFFLISGYIISHTSLREDRRSFFIKRLFRILPVLVVATVATWAVVRLIVHLGLPLFGLAQGTRTEWIQAVFLMDGYLGYRTMLSPTWTLVVELIFYLLVFILLTRQKLNPLASTWTMIALWLSISVVFINVPFFSSHTHAQTPFYLGFLIIGRLIYLAQSKLVSSGDAAIASVVAFLATCGFFETVDPGHLFTPGGWKGNEPIVSYVLAILIFLGLMRLAPKRVPQPFAFFGDISYSLYLLHFPLGILILTLLREWGITGTLAFVVTLMAVIAVSWASYEIVERPGQKFARWILRRDKASDSAQATIPVAEVAVSVNG